MCKQENLYRPIIICQAIVTKFSGSVDFWSGTNNLDSQHPITQYEPATRRRNLEAALVPEKSRGQIFL